MVEMRRSMTLSDHMSTPVSSATRRSQTLRSAIDSEAFASTSSSGTSRTLMDIIREEHAISRGEFPLNPADGGVGGGVSWKGFKDRLRLRRTSAAWTDAACGGAGAGGEPDNEEDGDLVIGFPTSPVFGRAIAARLNQAQMPGSLRERDPGNIPTPSVQIISNSAESSSSTPSSGEEEGGAAEGEPERVSLMALLGQSDPENGMSEDEEDAEEEEVVVVEEEKVGGGVHHVCCVCMVRHKGAAFIPCGHTFCRLCSRELWVSRGNCPLCNGYILEILDIF